MPTRLDDEDLATLRAWAREGQDVYLVRYRSSDDPAVDYLSAFHGTVEVDRYETVVVYRFSEYRGCPGTTARGVEDGPRRLDWDGSTRAVTR